MAVIDRYVRNKSMIEAVAKAFAIQVLFVWQPIPQYNYDLSYHFYGNEWGLHGFAKYGYPLMRETVDKKPLTNFVWCAEIQLGAREALYVDNVHYTPKMIEMVSGCIVDAIKWDHER